MCFELFDTDEKQALIIKCGHTLCKFCIETLLEDDTIKCPSCRKIHDVDSVDDLPVNWHIQKCVKNDKTELKGPLKSGQCVNHKDEKLKLYCKKCKLFIC